MLYGYARVSTTDQDLSLQETALKAAGCSARRDPSAGGVPMWLGRFRAVARADEAVE
jgi:hypothetical protein